MHKLPVIQASGHRLTYMTLLSWAFSRMKIPSTWDAFLFFRRQPPIVKREIDRVHFLLGYWWINVHDDARREPRPLWTEILWHHRLFRLFSIAFGNVTSVQITLHYRRFILSMKPNQTQHTWWSKTHLRERDTHTLVNALFVLFDQVMTLLVPRPV